MRAGQRRYPRPPRIMSEVISMRKHTGFGRALANAVLGLLGLAAANMFGLGLGMTAVNMVITVVLGIPGLILLFGVRWLF